MSWIRKRRIELGLSQDRLAEITGIESRRLSDLEGGLCLPQPECALALGRALQVEGGVPHASQVLSRDVLRRMTRPRPFEFPTVNAEPWQRMGRRFGWLVGRIRIDPEVAAWIQRCLECNSGQEGLSLLQLGAAGARPVIASAHACGYRGHGILDAQGNALGERMQPALHWVQPELECVLWPQITLINGLRVDLLVLLRVGRERSRWVVAEVDGPHHNAAQDALRDKWVGIPVFRVSNREVLGLGYAEALRQKFLVS